MLESGPTQDFRDDAKRSLKLPFLQLLWSDAVHRGCVCSSLLGLAGCSEPWGLIFNRYGGEQGLASAGYGVVGERTVWKVVRDKRGRWKVGGYSFRWIYPCCEYSKIVQKQVKLFCKPLSHDWDLHWKITEFVASIVLKNWNVLEFNFLKYVHYSS